MTSVGSEQALEATLARLETALLSPVISGELKAWLNNVRQAAATFAMDWTRYLHTTLHVQYAETMQSDPELSANVEKLIRADSELLVELAQFHEALQRIERQAAEIQWQEAKLEPERRRLEETGLGLILSIKRQRAAAETWLVESLYRDRGVKD